MESTQKKFKIPETTSVSLLQRVRLGQEKAWFEFYDKYVAMIRNIGKTHFLSASECDDLMVDVMVIFWNKIDQFFYDPEKGKFRHYLGKIALYASMKRLRGNKIFNKTEQLTDFPEDVDNQMMEEYRDYMIKEAMEELKNSVDSEIYQVFDMSFLQHRSIEDICAITRRSRNNVYVIRSRCLKKLRTIIRSYREEDKRELFCRSSRNAAENIAE